MENLGGNSTVKAQRIGSEHCRAQILSLSLLVGLNFCDSSIVMGSYNRDLLGDEMNQGNTCRAFGKVLDRQTALSKYILPLLFSRILHSVILHLVLCLISPIVL